MKIFALTVIEINEDLSVPSYGQKFDGGSILYFSNSRSKHKL